MVVSILFPVFAFTFTNFSAEEPTSLDIALSYQDLINAGIVLKDGVSANVTFAGAQVDYEFSNHSLKLEWYNHLVWGDALVTRRQGYLEKIVDTWFFPEELPYIINGVAYSQYNFDNITIVNMFDADYNWTLFKIPDEGLIGFISTTASDENNITKAVYETGVITVTLGAQAINNDTFDFVSFIDWYWALVVGQTDWGLPAFMGWIIKILSAYMVLGAIFLAKELTRL